VVANKKSALHGVRKGRVDADKKVMSKSHVAAETGTTIIMERRENRDRRGLDRRTQSLPVAIDRRTLQRRVKVSRRRQIDPTTCERDYTPDEIEFMGAMDEYKRRNGRMFPTCSEVLEVVRSLGYEKSSKTEAFVLPTVVLPSTPDAVSPVIG
jgi:hypothetical protein